MLQQFSDPGLLTVIDWQPVLAEYQRLCGMAGAGEITDVYEEPSYASKIYCVDGGCLVASDLLTEGVVWYVWAGANLERMIPECATLRQRLQTSGLNLVNFNYYSITGNIHSHIDGKTLAESGQGHCNLNYIVSSLDQHNQTWIKHNDHTQTAPTTADTLWLIDTTQEHGVSNKGHRETFQIKFHSPYQDVAHWLMSNPDFLHA